MYIIAVCPGEQGCLAWRTEGGNVTAALVKYLGLRTLDTGIDIMSVSSPGAYGEYKPYRYIDSELEFIESVLKRTDRENGKREHEGE